MFFTGIPRFLIITTSRLVVVVAVLIIRQCRISRTVNNSYDFTKGREPQSGKATFMIDTSFFPLPSVGGRWWHFVLCCTGVGFGFNYRQAENNTRGTRTEQSSFSLPEFLLCSPISVGSDEENLGLVFDLSYGVFNKSGGVIGDEWMSMQNFSFHPFQLSVKTCLFHSTNTSTRPTYRRPLAPSNAPIDIDCGCFLAFCQNVGEEASTFIGKKIDESNDQEDNFQLKGSQVCFVSK